MVDFNITPKMIDFYRKLPGNSVLQDNAIIELIKKDAKIFNINLPRNFYDLKCEAERRSSETHKNISVFGVNMNVPIDNTGLELEKQTTQELINKTTQTNGIFDKKVLDFAQNIIREEWGDSEFVFNLHEDLEIKQDDKTLKTKSQNGKPSYIWIQTKEKGIRIDFNKNGIKKEISNYKEDSFTRIMYDKAGNIESKSVYDYWMSTGDEKYLKTKVDYKKINELKMQSKEIASEIATDLHNKKLFFFDDKISENLPNTIEKITEDNVLYVMEEYSKNTGKNIIPDIIRTFEEKSDLEVEEYLKYTNHIKNCVMKAMKKIEKSGYTDFNLSSYLNYTGLIEDLKDENIDYNKFKETWQIFSYSNIQRALMHSTINEDDKNLLLEKSKAEGLRLIEEGNYKPNLKLENTRVENEYYKGKNTYDVQFGEIYEPVTIINKTTGEKRVLDLKKITQNMSPIEEADFWNRIQTLPAEVLEDLAIEIDNIEGEDNDYICMQREGYVGLYNNRKDYITTTPIRHQTTVHEIGHAIDYNYDNDTDYNINKTSQYKSKFNNIFKKEIETYKNKGNKTYNRDENIHYSGDGHYSYCTKNVEEMFAECYTLLMLGDCNSKEAILKYFPESLKATKELLEEIRKLPEETRHKREDIESK